jgi:hypothetical protein
MEPSHLRRLKPRPWGDCVLLLGFADASVYPVGRWLQGLVGLPHRVVVGSHDHPDEKVVLCARLVGAAELGRNDPTHVAECIGSCGEQFAHGDRTVDHRRCDGQDGRAVEFRLGAGECTVNLIAERFMGCPGADRPGQP